MLQAVKYYGRAILTIAIAACPTVCVAEGAVAGKITVMQSYNGHTGLLIQLNATQVNPDGCTSSNWYIFPDDSPRSAFVQSGMLAAMHSGKPIWVMLSGCYQAYPMIKHISLLP